MPTYQYEHAGKEWAADWPSSAGRADAAGGRRGLSEARGRGEERSPGVAGVAGDAGESGDGQKPCALGKRFFLDQSMKEEALLKCPECGGAVSRVIGGVYISSPTSDTDLRDKGFAKLVKQSDGTYENVTALEGESRVWDPNKPETMPDLDRRHLDG
ncbi:MAG: zinc ribbon domain-containing protein [Planctomycetota bacterium]